MHLLTVLQRRNFLFSTSFCSVWFVWVFLAPTNPKKKRDEFLEFFFSMPQMDTEIEDPEKKKKKEEKVLY